MTLREQVERSLDKLSAALPPEEPKTRQVDFGRRITTPPTSNRHIAPPKAPDTLQQEHKALIGKWATVELPDGEGTARLRIYTVTVRRDGRVRAEMRNGDRTIYRTPEELQDVGEK